MVALNVPGQPVVLMTEGEYKELKRVLYDHGKYNTSIQPEPFPTNYGNNLIQRREERRRK